MCIPESAFRVRQPGEEPEPRNKPFLENAGNALLTGMLPKAAAAGWGVMQAGADVVSTLLTGPLARARVLPEDPAARAAHTFASQRRGMEKVADQWRPKLGRDFAVDPDRVPNAARPFIQEWLQRNGHPTDEAAVRQIWRNRNTDLGVRAVYAAAATQPEPGKTRARGVAFAQGGGARNGRTVT
jgi:hypothetical protein